MLIKQFTNMAMQRVGSDHNRQKWKILRAERATGYHLRHVRAVCADILALHVNTASFTISLIL